MKFAAVLGIMLLATAILIGEWRSACTKQERVVAAVITVAAALLAMTLVFKPELPGPSQVVTLLFGWMDKRLDMK